MWTPCDEQEHTFDRLEENVYGCSKCGALGWTRLIPSYWKEIPQYRAITLYKCPICKGATQALKAPCPTCLENHNREKKRTKRKWSDLTPSQQKGMSFLATKLHPTYVSQKNGGASMFRLSLFGFVNKMGEKNGMSLWQLTLEGRTLIKISNISCTSDNSLEKGLP